MLYFNSKPDCVRRVTLMEVPQHNVVYHVLKRSVCIQLDQTPLMMTAHYSAVLAQLEVHADMQLMWHVLRLSKTVSHNKY